MAIVLRAAFDKVAWVADLFWNYTDPRSSHLPLVGSPVPIACIIAIYLYFVLSLGPRLMKNRKPFELRTVMLVYNAVQVVWCSLLVSKSLLVWNPFNPRYSFLCEPLSTTTEPFDFVVVGTVWLYFVLKVVDLLDTVFMILRKNSRQISFLHVYHHAGMVFCSWVGARMLPGGHHTFLGSINCVVHCLLYGYYFLSLYDARIKVAWWKKYITIVQIVQFGMNMIHEGIPLLMPDCGVNKMVSGVLVIQNGFMFALFTDFYLKNYSSEALERKKAKRQS